MKAQRRHELQTNSLSQAIDRSVEFLRQHGSRVLLGAIFVILLLVLIYQRISLARERAVDAQSDLARAWQQIGELQTLGRYAIRPEQLSQAVTTRKQYVDVARAAIADVPKQSDDRMILAQMHLVAAELNWQLANLPDFPGAATQPSLRLDADPKKYLAEARGHYETVLNDFGDQSPAVVAAHLGLAAVAENQLDWTEAAKQYEEVRKLPDPPKWAKNLADRELLSLVQIRRPIYVAPTPPAATMPSTLPTTEPTTVPTTRITAEAPPTTAAVPATVPAPAEAP